MPKFIGWFYKLGFVVCYSGFLAFTALNLLSPHTALIVPTTIAASPTFQVLAEQKIDRQIIGFLPYWNLKSIPNIPVGKFSTIYYFAIDVTGDGNFTPDDGGIQHLQSGDIDGLKERLTTSPNTRLGVTIVSLDADHIAQVVNNSVRQKRLVDNTVKLMKDNNFVDLNFDLEYAGTLDSQMIKNYTSLVSKITTAVHKNIPGSKVTLDAYADSVAKPRIFDIAEIGKIVDGVIIMGYDFHRLNSDTAGPIAPLFGKDKYQYEIFQSVIDYLSVVAADKLILAVPLYGYEWPTADPLPNSAVVDSSHGPEVSSYERSLQTARDNNVSINFDEDSKSAWFAYFDKSARTYRQVWFENERSLGLKFDLINQANLAGVGFWALGYDGDNNQMLWKTVEEKFK